MPITKSELMFFSAGLVVGAAAGANYRKLKETLVPVLLGAGDAIGEAYADVARKVAEKAETLQDAMQEMAHSPSANGSGASSPA